jgi:hypothetical protein
VHKNDEIQMIGALPNQTRTEKPGARLEKREAVQENNCGRSYLSTSSIWSVRLERPATRALITIDSLINPYAYP